MAWDDEDGNEEETCRGRIIERGIMEYPMNSTWLRGTTPWVAWLLFERTATDSGRWVDVALP